ncbi:MAG: hypothetical protein H6839_15465 [Planctomycetes bacterium]|nr:hypothetical protein [Planctomycetota bacterium]
MLSLELAPVVNSIERMASRSFVAPDSRFATARSNRTGVGLVRMGIRLGMITLWSTALGLTGCGPDATDHVTAPGNLPTHAANVPPEEPENTALLAGTWKCTEVIDGQTIKVERDNASERVTLLCVTLDHDDDHRAAEARRALSEFVLGRDVEVQFDPKHSARDADRNLCAYIIVEECFAETDRTVRTIVNVEMVRGVHAEYPAKRGHFESSLYHAEFKQAGRRFR